MKAKNFFSTLILLAMLVIIPVSTTILLNNGFEMRISALESDEPTNVFITDIKDKSFKVVWITEKEVIGQVKLADSSIFSEDISTSYHSVFVTGLTPSTRYTFKLISNAKEFLDKNGNEYSLRTASFGAKESNFLIYGQVFSVDGKTVQQFGLITLELNNGYNTSQTVSSLINENGGFQMNLGGMLTDDLSSQFSLYGVNENIFNVYVTNKDTSIEKRVSLDYSVSRQIPNIYLGDISIDVMPGIEGN